MKHPSTLPLAAQSLRRLVTAPTPSCPRVLLRHAHTTAARTAKVEPMYGIAPAPPPPPPAPVASPEHIASRIVRRKKQADLLRQATEARRAGDGERKGLRRRFWKDVTVKEIDGAYEIHLDTRPLRHPDTKEIVRLPLSKPHLAHALAVEWDQLTSAQQATKQHLIPLTSLVCRALDIAANDAAHAGGGGTKMTHTRPVIIKTLLRYLDTDSLLCWAPPADPTDPTRPESATDDSGRTLREVQESAAVPIVAFLTTHVWPGIELRPVLDSASIVPASQPPGVREVVHGWLLGLDAWELAGLERAVLAGKGLLGAVRLLAEWSEGSAGVRNAAERVAAKAAGGEVFGAEEAARAASIEVTWQIGRWGLVEDTHDVEHEDIRRQFASVVMLVSGTDQRSQKA